MTLQTSALFSAQIQAPYPGLRPFQPHEAPIFFGRSEHVADMLTVLENHRFLAVVGPSGGGKSSLVQAGLLPALKRGELLTAHSDDWRFVIMQPGDDPYLNLASATQARLCPDEGPPFHDGDAGLTEVVLRGSPLGFVDVLRDASVPDAVNVLLVIDQFEELFGYRARGSAVADSNVARRETAGSFVQLLLETARQTSRPVYVMLTMRSDFLGDCDLFDGLPESINQSQYLTPRLTLTQLTHAIALPVQESPFFGSVDPAVVQRILNDIGSGRDELPIMQHVLFRSWQMAVRERPHDVVRLTLGDYRKAGELKNALSNHADEALKELALRGQRKLVERVFVALCERGASGQPISRPVTVEQIADESGSSTGDIMSVVTELRRPERSFLIGSDRELRPSTMVKVSHESLLRQWTTLKSWIKTEFEYAETFKRLRDRAHRYLLGEESLLDKLALKVAVKWMDLQYPAAWAKRYGGGLEETLEYVSLSKKKQEELARSEALNDKRETERRAELVASAERYRKVTTTLVVFLTVVALAGGYAFWRFRAYRESIDAIVDAKGVITRSPRGGVSITFQPVAAKAVITRSPRGSVGVTLRPLSPDRALSLLHNIDDLETVSLRGTSGWDRGLGGITGIDSLRSLDLAFTGLNDHGAETVSQMDQLTSLLLNNTKVTEKGLSSLTKMRNLTTLDISGTAVSQDEVVYLRRQMLKCRIIYAPNP